MSAPHRFIRIADRKSDAASIRQPRLLQLLSRVEAAELDEMPGGLGQGAFREPFYFVRCAFPRDHAVFMVGYRLLCGWKPLVSFSRRKVAYTFGMIESHISSFPSIL